MCLSIKKVILIASKTIGMTSLCRHALDFRCGGLLFGKRVCGRGGDFASAEATKGRSPSGGFAIALWKPSPDRSFNYVVTRRWQVAAALSAAVTTAKLIGDAPTLQAEPTKKKNHTSNASYSSGEGVWGRGASLREAASPQNLSPNVFSGGSAREGTFLLEKSPPSHIFNILTPLL